MSQSSFPTGSATSSHKGTKFVKRNMPAEQMPNDIRRQAAEPVPGQPVFHHDEGHDLEFINVENVTQMRRKELKPRMQQAVTKINEIYLQRPTRGRHIQ
jgi:hypothetical protein